MRRILLIVFLLVHLVIISQNCNYPLTKKVLLVGDSWGNFMWVYRSYKEAFDKFGYPDYIEEGTSTVENGAEAEDFIVQPKLGYVINALNANPDIDYVLISLGGNDVLGDWHKSFTPAQTDSLLDIIEARLNILIDTIQNTRPGIHILLSGYDYPNFGETCYLIPTGAYANLFADMGSPTFPEINGALCQLIQRFEQMSQNTPNLQIVNNLGLMQYVYGQSAALIVPPYLPPYAPGTVPLPGGNINYPSPQAAMLLNMDAFHLSQDAYRHFSARQTELFFWPMFRSDKDTTFYGIPGNTEGTIDYSGNIIQSQLSAGNNNNIGAASCILTFNTEAIPDNATVTGACLFLTRSSVSGQNPVSAYGTAAFELDLKSGFFGTSDSIEVIDFSSVADAVNVACAIGTAADNTYKIRFEITDIPSLQYINKTGITQLRLRINMYDAAASNIISFFNSSAQEVYRPVLDVKYDISSTTMDDNISVDDVNIYPNPSHGDINITAKELWLTEIFTIDGRKIKTIHCFSDRICLNSGSLSAGLYMFRVYTGKTCVIKKVVIN
ncbi:MAG: hypothetical protein BWY70_01388 [Bacteroidetes bacterium ADurb.Bin408]|nr:MAG: hypothetical protein BWY70_01388 [Bacteroidetes bacterium ADurb.Bin408]